MEGGLLEGIQESWFGRKEPITPLRTYQSKRGPYTKKHDGKVTASDEISTRWLSERITIYWNDVVIMYYKLYSLHTLLTECEVTP